MLPIYSLSGGKNPSVSSCSIYIWNTQPYLSLANSFFSVRSFCLKHYLFFLYQRDHLIQPLHSALHSSAFQQQEALVPMQNLFYSCDFFSILQMLFLPFEVHVLYSHLRVVVSASTQRLPSSPQLFQFWMCSLFFGSHPIYHFSLSICISL